ncbi:hypothetical protein NU195Hw_g8764t1 [Hortaea werneckii]
MLATQPVVGADVFMFQWVLHRLPFDKCVLALRALIPAIRPGARVLVVEKLVQPSGIGSDSTGSDMRLHLLGARNRGLEEWQVIFAAADRRFVFASIRRMFDCHLAILEFIWRDSIRAY